MNFTVFIKIGFIFDGILLGARFSKEFCKSLASQGCTEFKIYKWWGICSKELFLIYFEDLFRNVSDASQQIKPKIKNTKYKIKCYKIKLNIHHICMHRHLS